MNPYGSHSVATRESDTEINLNTNPNGRFTSAAIGATVAAISLLGWAVAIIYYISATYHPNMGFWAVILLGIALLLLPAVAFGVFRLSHCCSGRTMAVPYLFAAIGLGLVVSTTIPAITWLQASNRSLLLTYGVLAVLMTTPPFLLGFTLSGLTISPGFRRHPSRRTIA